MNGEIKDKRIAVLLFGLYYCNTYRDVRGNTTTINIMETNNIKEFLQELSQYNTLDYYIHTTSAPYDDLLKLFFNTNNIIFDNDPPIRPGGLIYKKRNERILSLFNIINIHDYDYFIISRLDCTFIMSFFLLDINWNKFNVSMKCERATLFDDNFFIVPKFFINNFIKCLEICKQYYLNSHHASILYNTYIGNENIHFIIKGLYWINAFTPLYIFPRQITIEQKGFLLNRLCIDPKYKYLSNGATLDIYSKYEYCFRSNKKGSYHYIGYSLYDPSEKINIKFDILLLNKLNYSRFIGLKTESPNKIYNDWIKKLKINEWITIELDIIINTDLLNHLILLIFDDVDDVNFEIKNFKCGNVNPSIMPFN